ncbi:MAG TPA: UDP-N-acetylmuramoyl-L-alanyl-D-glutamate--2,6-diaminopimelate ligase [Thermoanaerobaculia bacterium]|jgi:UDP-N-acetylmuramoyl-L-alanyl-D-glutamate--2,6-diaminopimelate ligase|nr:UDP-N-acetylmuramoyl-L-alanyl-D-glutamate--2,6-diaminopimelate ligase [Thermoanaerobaculia bacterium]
MRLSDLVRGLPVSCGPGPDPEVSGVAHDSRAVAPGDVFVALVGQRFDGRAFAGAAVAKGAVAVIGPAPESARPDVPWLVTADPRGVLGPLAARAYGHPDQELALAGVTGTNGKSTVATLITAVFEAAGRPAGFLGTLGYRFQDRAYAGGHTTPEASDLFRILRKMRDDGAEAVAMEVSSHALAMGRVGGASFDAAVFTNLTRDHLDYHRDMEDYFAAKRQLFSMLKPGQRPAVNLDDPYGRRLAAELPDALTFGEGGDVSVRARETELSTSGVRGVLATPRGDLPFTSPLLGRYNLSNLLAAAAAAETLELPHAAVAAAFAAQRPVPGRMEPVDRGQPFPVFVDYAHTDAALEAALRSAREMVGVEKVAVVFGCGGDRDPGKRPMMGRVAGELADLVIATSDNPRSEDPLAILAAVEEGLRASGNHGYRLIPDRREAIHEAVASAGPGWAVVVAGKGHEREQIVGDRKLPFSDLEEIGKALEERFGSAVGR